MTPSERMRLSLAGLSVGDAFGGRIMEQWSSLQRAIENRRVPPGPWPYSDDTEMALSIVQVLSCLGKIDPDQLAAAFAEHYDSARGYGGSAHRIFQQLRDGADWRSVSSTLFGGSGSYAVGAAKRVAPLGAYFAHDLDALIANATLSAQVTHAHPDGIAGAVAVALGAAYAWRTREEVSISTEEILTEIADRIQASDTRRAIRTAAALPASRTSIEAAAALGSGHDVSAQDTVPFALWCAFRNRRDYSEALWTTVAGLGDMDSTCAIVGGIVALSARQHGIPSDWLAARERLPEGF